MSSKKRYKKIQQEQKASSKEEDDLEYENWIDVIKELPIIFVILFLLIPFFYLFSKIVEFIAIYIRDNPEITFVCIATIIISIYIIYVKYFRY